MKNAKEAIRAKLPVRPIFISLERITPLDLYEFWAVGEDSKGLLRKLHGYYDNTKDEIVITDNQPLSYSA